MESSWSERFGSADGREEKHSPHGTDQRADVRVPTLEQKDKRCADQCCSPVTTMMMFLCSRSFRVLGKPLILLELTRFVNSRSSSSQSLYPKLVRPVVKYSVLLRCGLCGHFWLRWNRMVSINCGGHLEVTAPYSHLHAGHHDTLSATPGQCAFGIIRLIAVDVVKGRQRRV